MKKLTTLTIALSLIASFGTGYLLGTTPIETMDQSNEALELGTINIDQSNEALALDAINIDPYTENFYSYESSSGPCVHSIKDPIEIEKYTDATPKPEPEPEIPFEQEIFLAEMESAVISCVHIGSSSEYCSTCNPSREITHKVYRVYHEGKDQYYIAERDDSGKYLGFVRTDCIESLVPEDEYVFDGDPKYIWTLIIEDIKTVEQWNDVFFGTNNSNTTLDEVIDEFLSPSPKPESSSKPTPEPKPEPTEDLLYADDNVNFG